MRIGRDLGRVLRSATPEGSYDSPYSRVRAIVGEGVWLIADGLATNSGALRQMALTWDEITDAVAEGQHRSVGSQAPFQVEGAPR